MTTREQKLRELVERWRSESHSCGMGGFAELSAFYEIAADELASILNEEVEVSDAMVEAAARVVCRHAHENWDDIGEFTQGVLKETQREAITAALKEAGK